MEEKEQILIQDGWIIDITTKGKGLKIDRILARFGHKTYFPLDTSEFTQEQWDIFYEQIHTGRIITNTGAKEDENTLKEAMD